MKHLLLLHSSYTEPMCKKVQKFFISLLALFLVRRSHPAAIFSPLNHPSKGTKVIQFWQYPQNRPQGCVAAH